MRRRRAFSIIELIVVIGIMAVLIALLFPALRQARLRARQIACQSNMRQIGQAMMIYANENKGWLFPPDHGLDVPLDQRWFLLVLKAIPPKDQSSTDPHDWTPKIMLCPADDPSPEEYHSYILNHHLVEHHIMYSSKPPANLTVSDVVVMGEKLTLSGNYYVETFPSTGNTSYHTQVDEARHGRVLGSNYLFLDMHVGPLDLKRPIFGVDRWDFPAPGEVQ